MEIPNELFVNLMLDWKKNKIDKKVKARLIKEYRDKHKLSQRKLGELLDISHSVIADWEQYGNVSNKQTREMKNAGFNDTEIYREIRNNRGLNCEGKGKPSLDKEFTRMTYQLQQITKNFLGFEITPETEYLARNMRDIVSRLIMKLDRIEKK